MKDQHLQEKSGASLLDMLMSYFAAAKQDAEWIKEDEESEITRGATKSFTQFVSLRFHFVVCF